MEAGGDDAQEGRRDLQNIDNIVPSASLGRQSGIMLAKPLQDQSFPAAC